MVLILKPIEKLYKLYRYNDNVHLEVMLTIFELIFIEALLEN